MTKSESGNLFEEQEKQEEQRKRGWTSSASSVSVPCGRSLKVRIDVKRFWYHDLRGRHLAANGDIEAYPLMKAERELVGEYRDGSENDLFVYLSPSPLSDKSIRIDLSQLDADQFRLTGQIEGFGIYRGSIPKKAQG